MSFLARVETVNVVKDKTKFQYWNIRKLKQQRRRRRLRKRHLEGEFTLLQTLSHLFHLVQFVKCWQTFLELSSRGLNQSSGKEKESLCLVSTSAKKRENWEVSRHSRAVTAKKCTKKRDAWAKLFFANINLLLFCRSCCCAVVVA